MVLKTNSVPKELYYKRIGQNISKLCSLLLAVFTKHHKDEMNKEKWKEIEGLEIGWVGELE